MMQVYYLVLGYFLLGALGFWLINRRKSPEEARRNWLKYGTYFVIIHVVFASICFDPVAFRILGAVIVLAGYVELSLVFRKSGFRRPGLFACTLAAYSLLGAGFLLFGLLAKEQILHAFLVVSAFDAFSQVTGQLAGRRKMLPTVSPAKTVEGLVGGAALAVLTAVLLRRLPGLGLTRSVLTGCGVALFALAGDLLASWYKRQYHVKDYSRALPGHGGFLDRFDSLIAGGAFVYLLSRLIG